MSRPVTYRELCLKAKAMGWRVQLQLSHRGPAAGCEERPARLTGLRVSDGDGNELGFVFIHPKHSLDAAAALLSEEMRHVK